MPRPRILVVLGMLVFGLPISLFALLVALATFIKGTPRIVAIALLSGLVWSALVFAFAAYTHFERL